MACVKDTSSLISAKIIAMEHWIPFKFALSLRSPTIWFPLMHDHTQKGMNGIIFYGGTLINKYQQKMIYSC